MTSTGNRKAPRIVWFRRDLRLADNEALAAAAASGAAIVPLFIDDDADCPRRQLGGAARWWRGRSVAALDESLRAIGSRLIIRRGGAHEVLRSLLAETGANTIHLNLRRDGLDDDAALISALQGQGVAVEAFDANYLHDPLHLRTSGGRGFKMFTPFWNRLRAIYRARPALPPIPRLAAPARWPESLPVDSLQVAAGWTSTLAQAWRPGEAAAQMRLQAFTEQAAAAYARARDVPGRDGTSRLSPHLAWGEISVHAIWRQLEHALGKTALPYLRELGWRDFNMHLLRDFPELPWRPMLAKFAAFPVVGGEEPLRAWRRGQTGYPLVDAGMRQLWRTGWMHNRARMIAASFLVKDLLVPWQRGEEWFWDTLVDADPAQNGGNWQWVAGCGADAAPFFRIFNPVLQGERFDPRGAYVRQWVPELAALPDRLIHQPWSAPPSMLSDAGIVLGRTYPFPLVDHAAARRRALELYRRMSGTGDGQGSNAPPLL